MRRRWLISPHRLQQRGPGNTHEWLRISCTVGLRRGSRCSMCVSRAPSVGPSARGGGAGSPRPIASKSLYTLSPSNGYRPVVMLYLVRNTRNSNSCEICNFLHFLIEGFVARIALRVSAIREDPQIGLKFTPIP